MGDRLRGKTALVTGASRGIGRAIAQAFAREGANVALNARDLARLEETASALRAQYAVEFSTYACDVSDREKVDDMVSAIEQSAQIDILVNNAGMHKSASFMDHSFEDFKNIVEVNLYSVFHVTQAALPKMIARKAGRIINIASSAGKWGSRNQSAYNASKHAVVGITRCLGLELAPHNILTNAICPWVVETDLADSFMREHSAAAGVDADVFMNTLKNSVPLKRWIQPEEVANLAVFLASEESSYINGQSWSVDGGYTMI
ncbi:MAG: SDR family NAD(P)-dependent oxidoreductase [Proteobacteria bacterium]|nr:SDR family NAD(P)-dependent oxidoreductase [Pseudomonadota bacterium]